MDFFIPITLFICIALIIASYFFFNAKTGQRQQETLQQLIESGQALSPELISSIAKPVSGNEHKDFSRGILLISLAIAIVIYGYMLDDQPEFMALGIFPFAIGAALLFINKFKQKDIS